MSAPMSSPIETLQSLFDREYYTREFIEKYVKLEEQLNTAPLPPISRLSMYTARNTSSQPKGPGKQIIFCSYHQLAYPQRHRIACDPKFKGMLVRVADRPRREPSACCDTVDQEAEFANFKQKWLKSQMLKDIAEHLTKHAPQMAHVSKVVCFGLGHLATTSAPSHLEFNPEDHGARSWIQHVAASQIGDMLRMFTGNPDIRFYAQDPAYCDNCMEILSQNLQIEVLDGNRGFLELDSETFVISVAPDVPVQQIVGDMLGDSGGPAGMFCQQINGDEHGRGMSALSSDTPFDASSPRVQRFRMDNGVLEKEGLNDVDATEAWSVNGRLVDVGACAFGPFDHGIYLRKGV